MNNAFRKIFPFAVTIILWYLSNPRLNPFGILSIIPIFYYMFSEPRRYWFGFGLFMCFLLDFNADTLFLFCSAFLMMNALNSLYGILDGENSRFHVKPFGIFLGMIAVFLLAYSIFGIRDMLGFVAGMIWLGFWLVFLYVPMAAAFQWVENDR